LRIALAQIVEFWKYAGELKVEQRKGWRRLPLNRIESVADHSFAVALLAMLEAERRHYRIEEVVRLALIHDLEEAITGDLTPEDKRMRGKTRVRAIRRKAVDELISALPRQSRGRYRRLWTDLRLGRTRESRLVHELDRLEMALQAKAYEKRVGRKRVMAFYESASRSVKDPVLAGALKSLIGGS
jgi:putative hydrolases of HD superfamily